MTESPEVVQEHDGPPVILLGQLDLLDMLTTPPQVE